MKLDLPALSLFPISTTCLYVCMLHTKVYMFGPFFLSLIMLNSMTQRLFKWNRKKKCHWRKYDCHLRSFLCKIYVFILCKTIYSQSFNLLRVKWWWWQSNFFYCFTLSYYYARCIYIRYIRKWHAVYLCDSFPFALKSITLFS